ncbi:MAG: hypothetical protein RIE59_13180 [Imperialibacter sp.]
MKRILVLMMLIAPGASFAQSEVGIGFLAGYNYMNGIGWNEVVRHYNLAHPQFDNNQPLLQNGFFAGFEFDYEIGNHIFITPELVYKRVRSVTDNKLYEIDLLMHFITLEVSAEVYVFELGKRVQKGFAHDFYMMAGPGVSYMLPRVYQDLELKNGLDGEPYKPSKMVPFLGAGVGYDIYFNKNFGVSPFFRVNAYFPFEIDDFPEVVLGSNVAEVNDRTSVFNFQVGMSWRYHRSGYSRK